MQRGTARYALRALALVLVLLGSGAVGQAGARPTPGPRVEIQSAAGLAPDAQSMVVQVLASCPERWSVVEAIVNVSQPEASGQASFPLACIGLLRMFTVVVPSAAGTFQLGEAQVTASIVIERGKTQRAADSQPVDVQPTIFVELADTARLESEGGAVALAVTVACPNGTNGLRSSLNVSQAGQVTGNGSYVPVCDGSNHTFEVRVQASGGVYRPGTAQALTFADVEFAGNVFSGVDDGAVQIVS